MVAPAFPVRVAESPIVFSETSDYIRLNFATFTVEFYKGTYGYNKVYDRNGNVLVYDDRAVVEVFKANKWTQRGVPYSLTWEKLYDADRASDYCYYRVTRHYTDYLGTTYTLTYTVKSNEAMKLAVTLNSGQTDAYRIAWYLSGIQKTTQKAGTNSLIFGNEAIPYDWVAFDWNDVYDSLGNITTTTTEVKADGIKASIYFGIGTVQAGKTITLDPSFVANGSSSSGTGAVTPTLPAGIAVNDILLLFAESNTNEAVTIADSAGGTWTEVTGSPQNSTASRLTVFWSRYNGTQTAPTTNDPGDHIIASIAAWRGCITTGNPWDVTSGAVHDVSNTAVSIPGATTTVDNCLVIAIVGHGIDSTKVQVNNWANASLSDLVERLDYATNAAGGGGFAVAEGGKANAGAYNATTATLAANSTKGLMTIALRPPPVPSPPTNLASPSQTSTTIDLTWTKGTNSDKTLIRFRDDQYPIGVTDGELAYFGTGESVTVDGGYFWQQDDYGAFEQLSTGDYQRVGQRHTSFPATTILRVSFYLAKFGSPTGTAYIRIRKTSDDSILAAIAEFDPNTYLTTTPTRYDFNCNVINPETQGLRFCVEYNDSSSPVRVYFTNSSISGNLFRYTTAGGYVERTTDACISVLYAPLQPATTYYFRTWGYESYTGQYSSTTADLTQATSGAPPAAAWKKLAFTSEPPTPNAWNQLKLDAGTGWRKLFLEGE